MILHYAIHQLYFKISDWLLLPIKEKAFYIASIQLKIAQEEKERKRAERKS